MSRANPGTVLMPRFASVSRAQGEGWPPPKSRIEMLEVKSVPSSAVHRVAQFPLDDLECRGVVGEGPGAFPLRPEENAKTRLLALLPLGELTALGGRDSVDEGVEMSHVVQAVAVQLGLTVLTERVIRVIQGPTDPRPISKGHSGPGQPQPVERVAVPDDQDLQRLAGRERVVGLVVLYSGEDDFTDLTEFGDSGAHLMGQLEPARDVITSARPEIESRVHQVAGGADR